ncbi:MAG TPA: M48 family peptidase, partial [Telluria sp.]|nr:M48 family peptidase [Telluria sp.]
MRIIKQFTALLALSLCIGVAPAQQRAQDQQVQDGIAVKPLSRARVLISAEQVEAQSSQQYLSMLTQARDQGALFPN